VLNPLFSFLDLLLYFVVFFQVVIVNMSRYDARFRLLYRRLHQRTGSAQYSMSLNLLLTFFNRAYTEGHEISSESGRSVLSVPGFIT
jgi:hypothetical protein